MSEALTIEPISWWREAAPLLGGRARERCRPKAKAEPPVPPIGQPGTLWLVELPATDLELSPPEHQALTSAHIVIYDRILAPIVARLLPLGSYAEPAGPNEKEGDAAWDRALRFARDGWNVVKLVHAASLSQQEETHAQDRVRTIIFDLADDGAVPRFSVASANGLAG